MNVNLSIQLEKALSSQKISSATTTQIVKMIQADLGRVINLYFVDCEMTQESYNKYLLLFLGCIGE